MILLDTNLLTRITDRANPHYAAARRAIHTLLAANEQVVIAPQNLYEFWAVATRKRGAPPDGQNGLGMATDRAAQWLRFFRRRYTLMPNHEELLDQWHRLVTTLGVTGLRSHDARLVAAMQCYGIARLLTFNAGHFRGFPIEIVDPVSI
jgi:predicted nucleic acid-binding protein